MIKYRFLLTILLGVATLNLIAQTQDRSVKKKEYTDIQGFKIGWTPSALIHKWMGYQLNLAYGFNQRYEINSEHGILVGKNEGLAYLGQRHRLGIRYYFQKDSPIRLYNGLSYQYRVLDLDLQESFSRFDRQYFQELVFSQNRQSHGLMFQIGVVKKVGNFMFDVGICNGVGVSVVKSNVPSDAVQVSGIYTFFENAVEGEHTQPLLFYTFKIKYCIGGKKKTRTRKSSKKRKRKKRRR